MWAAGVSHPRHHEHLPQAALTRSCGVSKMSQLSYISLLIFFPFTNIIPEIKTSLILFLTLGSYDSFIVVPH